MQHLRLRFLLPASTALMLALSPFVAGAQSGSAVLLQLGEHDSQEAARASWNELQQKYPQQLGKLSLHVSPSQFGDEETFRTQASGIGTYQKAQEVCGDLASKGVDCSVVETAFFAPAAAESTAAESTVAESTVAQAAPEQLPALEELAAEPAPAAPPADLPALPAAATANDTTTAEATTLPALENPLPASAPESAATPQQNTFSTRYLPWLGFGSDANATPEAAVKEESTAWQQAEQNAAESDARKEAQAAAAALQTTQAAPQTTRPRPQRLDQQKPDTSLVASTYAPAAAAPAPIPAPIPAPAPAPTPAPAPVAAAPAPVTAPQELAPQTQPTASFAEAEVAEAVQVPVTFDERPTPKTINKPVGYGGFPSQPAPRGGTSWLQLSYFPDKDSAFAFSRELTSQLPEVMQMTRIRIVSPFASSRGLQKKTSMRVGPFRTDNDAQTVCHLAEQKGLKCSAVQEIGNSAAANTPRGLASAPREQYGRRVAAPRGYTTTPGAAPAGAYWVQLGAFNSAVAAQQYWQQLSATHPDALGRLRPQVSYPALSSSPTPIYHLRTGPFVNKVPGLDLCGVLRGRQVSCILVQER